jgi:hypothetical protein
MVSNSPALRRRVGTQKFLLASYAEVGKLNEAVWELVHLHDREPGHYRQLTGSDDLPQYETLRRYWKQIPIAQRRAAKQRFLGS